MYEGKMSVFPVSVPPHFVEWLKNQPEGASEWVRHQIEVQIDLEKSAGSNEAFALANLERAQAEIEAIQKKKQEVAEQDRLAEAELQKKQEFAITRNELDNLKVLWRTEYNEIYARFRAELPGFNPLHEHRDSKILLDALKERIVEKSEEAKKEVDTHGIGTSEVEPGSRA